MKKLLALFLALILAFSLCGCSSEEVTEPVEEVVEETSEPSVEEPEEKVVEEPEEEVAAEEPAPEVSEEVVVSEVEEPEEEAEEYIVYRTKTGKKYHRDGCVHLKSRYELTLEEAESRGLTPCSVCNP